MKKFNFIGLDDGLKAGLAEISAHLKFEVSESGTPVSVNKADKLSVKRTDSGFAITYTRNCEFFRALSFLVAGSETEENCKYSDLCYMADMSRNAVYNMETAKKTIRMLAICGYSSLMLYTEDTFEVEGYPYLGHMRGRLTKAELKEINDYAYMLGVEVIPCIQTLAHFTAAMRWPGLSSICDNKDILLVGDEKTHKFIQAMIDTCKECFRSRRINIGMDEAHTLGLGRYLRRNGYRKISDIMLDHLNKVVEICTESGVRPMMWSDMFFRMVFDDAYYVRQGEIPQEVIDKVPENLTLIYWDYYSLDEQLFTHMVNCHLKFNNPVGFAGGAWKWYGFAPHNRHSLASTKMQLDVCFDKGLDFVIVTSWGDNGAEASQFSAFPTVLYFAERGYTDNCTDEWLEQRSRECFGIGFEEFLTIDAPNELPRIPSIGEGRPCNPSKYLLFNDPLEGLVDSCMDRNTASGGFAASAERLEAMVGHEEFGYIFDTLAKLCRVLEDKCDLSIRLRDFYKAGDMIALESVAKFDLPGIIEKLDSFIEAFRYQWYKENKTIGFGVQELRLGGLRARLESTKLRLEAYTKGEIDRIDELEQPFLTFNGRAIDDPRSPYTAINSWISNASGCVI